MPKRRSGLCGEDDNLWSLLWIEPQSISRPVICLVAFPTEWSRFNICTDGHYQQAFIAGWYRPEYAEGHREELWVPECHHPWKLLGLAVSMCSSGLWCSLRQHVFRPRLTDLYLTLWGVLTIILVRLGYSFIATNKVAGGLHQLMLLTPGELQNLWRAPYVGNAVRTVTDLQSTVVTVCSTCC